VTATPPGELFIISAPSGAGKTTLIRSLLRGELGAEGRLAFSISHTTRRQRAEEADGRQYHFVSHAEFRDLIAAGEFLEWAEVHGHLYGTARSEVLPLLARGLDVLLDIDVQGAANVLAQYPEAHSIFILPPSYRDLEHRLRQRGLDDPAEIARRLAVSLSEIKRYPAYRYVIVNVDAAHASATLAAIIQDKRHRRERMAARAAAIVADFAAALSESIESAESAKSESTGPTFLKE
jgi:guanylate kinase